MSIGSLLGSFMPQISSFTSVTPTDDFASGGGDFFAGPASSNFMPNFGGSSILGGSSNNSSSSFQFMLMMIMMVLLLRGSSSHSNRGSGSGSAGGSAAGSGGTSGSSGTSGTSGTDSKPTEKGGFLGSTTPQELYNRHKADPKHVVIVDVRDAKSFATEHAKDAINMPKEQWANAKFDPNVEYDFMCYSKTCTLGKKAADYFAAKGFKTRDMEGGYPAWPAAGLPTEKA